MNLKLLFGVKFDNSSGYDIPDKEPLAANE